MRLHPSLVLALLSLAACSPSAFDDLRNSVRRDAGPSEDEVDGAAGDEAGAGGNAGRSGSAGRAGAGARAGSESRAGAGAGGRAGSAGTSGAAGEGGRSGAVAGAGSGTAGGEAGSSGNSAGGSGAGAGGGSGSNGIGPAAGSGGSATSCGDTTSDPRHCGACDRACGDVSGADVSCVQSNCVSKCRAGFGDCNDDLGTGSSGNGCETSVSANLKHCGACGISCKPPGTGLATCEAGSCVAYATQVGTPRAVTTTPHGSVGGQAYDQTCPDGLVLVGLDVATTGDIAFGINALCAPLTLSGSGAAATFTVGTPIAPHTLVGGIIDPTPPIVRFPCPPNTVVAGVAGVTYRWTDGTRTGEPSIRSISLACNELSLDARRRVVFTPKMVVDIGDREGEVQLYTDMCQESEVVVGFKGYAGAYLDALQTYCSPISLAGSPFEGTASPK